MPVNIGITFLVGGVLGWIAVKLVKPRPHLEGLVVATCASGTIQIYEPYFFHFFWFENVKIHCFSNMIIFFNRKLGKSSADNCPSNV